MKEDFWEFCARNAKEMDSWPEEKKAFLGIKTNWPSALQPLKRERFDEDDPTM